MKKKTPAKPRASAKPGAKRTRKKILPVYYLKMAHMLKQGISRQEIAEEMTRKHGLTQKTIKRLLYETFPQYAIRSGVPIDALLWEKKRSVLSSEDRRVIAQKREAAKTPEAKRERVRKIWSKLTPEQRREKGRKMAEARWRRKKPDFVIPDAKRLAELFEQSDASTKKLADEVGVSQNTVRIWIKKAGIDVKSIRERVWKRKIDDACKRVKAKGQTFVIPLFRLMGIAKGDRRAKGEMMRNMSPKILENLFELSGGSVGQLASNLGLNEEVTSRWIKEGGIDVEAVRKRIGDEGRIVGEAAISKVTALVPTGRGRRETKVDPEVVKKIRSVLGSDVPIKAGVAARAKIDPKYGLMLPMKGGGYSMVEPHMEWMRNELGKLRRKMRDAYVKHGEGDLKFIEARDRYLQFKKEQREYLKSIGLGFVKVRIK